MLKQTVKYEDFDGNEVTEDLYFYLSKSELTTMELECPGGLSKHYQKLIDTKDTPELMKVFKELILKAYGVKSADGKHFQKGPQVRAEFESSAAFDAIFMELVSSPEKMSAFANGILPVLPQGNEVPKIASAK